jgi:hypothetical protein
MLAIAGFSRRKVPAARSVGGDMTRQQKVVLIALAGVLLVFALVLLRGGLQNGDCRGADTKKCSDNYIAQSNASQSEGEGGGLKATFGDWLAPLAPKVKLPKDAFVLPGGSFSVPVAADEKPFRVGRMRLMSGAAAKLFYRDTGTASEKPDSGLHEQRLDLSSDKTPEGTFVATRQGGVLIITCIVPCTVAAR